ncbi:site-specific DNA-methyltransferase [Corticibacter populi]|uniref:site-specific DNA-methyltransferase (adenine-specific) n=1 Tax=Corticibacter populi TaxID=1550736 RepID=A0A3M6QT81_9BURK|nr:site-specific DNA-methyltransferase [Corticibacter populi]RMX06061.1 site-specific DNA-methyltransferase [Corticibacter populi]RZS30715.1 adenine-specific DNA-methyltransferase [Corticibacter populi]
MSKQKLELTWVGKEKRPKLEPRILLEDPEKSYHAKQRVSENDIFDNRLIFGDNLLALKALEQEFAGKVKCVFIDPPYNTGSAFTHYDDGLEHSIWLGLMRDRLEIIKRLLSDDGSLWITIDDNEAHYLKVLCDEVFGRRFFVADVSWRTTDNSNNNAKTFSLDTNHVLIYGRSTDWVPNFIQDDAKRSHFKNPDNDPRGPWFDGNPVNNPALRPNLQFNLVGPYGDVIKHPPNGWRWSKDTIEEKIKAGEIRFSEDGKRIIRRTYLQDMDKGLPPSNFWASLDDTGHNRQAKYELKNLFPEIPTVELFGTPKPERLLRKILELATNSGDLVLDSFAGSGTTGAVAHKMGRRWIMVELGEHCHTHIIPRLKKVIDGEDPGGITKAVDWQGGGGFRYYRLAPSLIVEDRWGNPVINPEYNAAQLAEALCKLEGFTYAPSETRWWQQGHSSERDFLYVTTQNLSAAQLQALSDEVGAEQSLLVCCAAFHGISAAAAAARWPNLTLKKIPKMVLARCEWGHDDYSLNVANLPLAEPSPTIPAAKAAKSGRKPSDSRTTDLFGDGEDA